MEQEAEFQRRHRERIVREARLRRHRAKMAAKAQADDTSDSEIEVLTSDAKKMDLTPAGSTPQELVKLDPSEIGMSVGYKNL